MPLPGWPVMAPNAYDNNNLLYLLAGSSPLQKISMAGTFLKSGHQCRRVTWAEGTVNEVGSRWECPPRTRDVADGQLQTNLPVTQVQTSPAQDYVRRYHGSRASTPARRVPSTSRRMPTSRPSVCGGWTSEPVRTPWRWPRSLMTQLMWRLQRPLTELHRPAAISDRYDFVTTTLYAQCQQ